MQNPININGAATFQYATNAGKSIMYLTSYSLVLNLLRDFISVFNAISALYHIIKW